MFNKSFKVILLIMFSLYAALFTGCLLGDDIDTIRVNAGVKEPNTGSGGSGGGISGGSGGGTGGGGSGGGNGTETNPYSLTNNVWTNDIITSTSSTAAVWYSFPVNAGTTYYLWWNDSYNGNNTKTLDIKVNIYFNNAQVNSNLDSGYTDRIPYSASSNGTFKIKVMPYISGDTGTFGIVYNTSGTRPSP